MAAASQLKMKTLKFNVPRCQALIVPAHSKNWPLLNKGCVFQLKRCQQRDYIFSFESRWTKAQENCLYCTKTHRKPKRKLAVSQTPAQWPNPGWCLLYSWNRAHFCFILLVSAPGVRAATQVRQMLCLDAILPPKPASNSLLRELQEIL